MHPSAQRTAGVIAVAAAVALALWAAARLLGVDLNVDLGGEVRQVTPADVLIATIVAGLAAWVTHSILARTPRTARWWPFIGSTAIAISMIGPSYQSDDRPLVPVRRRRRGRPHLHAPGRRRHPHQGARHGASHERASGR
jgi:Family of unknown function (DUF6069)